MQQEKIVKLDTKIFEGKKPRDWHKIVKEYVYNNLAGKQSNNIRNLSVINIEKILQSLVCFGENCLHNHQWLDENGWKFRVAYVKYDKIVWEITLNIAKTKDKRNILYDINKIKKVEQTDGSSIKGHSQRSTFSDKNIP